MTLKEDGIVEEGVTEKVDVTAVLKGEEDVSRRGFLKIAGLATATTGAAMAGLTANPDDAQAFRRLSKAERAKKIQMAQLEGQQAQARGDAAMAEANAAEAEANAAEAEANAAEAEANAAEARASQTERENNFLKKWLRKTARN